MQELWRWGNLGAAFALELAAFGILGYWGWKTGTSTLWRVGLAVGLPVAGMVLWGLFAAAEHPTFDSPVLALATKVLVFGSATIALWAIGARYIAVAFALLVIANLVAIRLGNLSA